MVQAAEKHIKWGFFEIAIWSIIHNQKQTVDDGLFLVFLFLSDRLEPDDEGFAMFAASAKRNTERCSVRQTCALKAFTL